MVGNRLSDVESVVEADEWFRHNQPSPQPQFLGEFGLVSAN